MRVAICLYGCFKDSDAKIDQILGDVIKPLQSSNEVNIFCYFWLCQDPECMCNLDKFVHKLSPTRYDYCKLSTPPVDCEIRSMSLLSFVNYRMEYGKDYDVVVEIQI
jgi:hypothetical protein